MVPRGYGADESVGVLSFAVMGDDAVKKIWKYVLVLCMTMVLSVGCMGEAVASDVGRGKKIVFIPLDNRPITDRQTREVVSKLGYDVVVPPEHLLGTREQPGDPDGLWAWLGEHAAGADAAVLSADAMLYGSLVASRNHVWPEDVVAGRVQNFRELHERFPRLPVYVFSTVLRTLLSANHSGAGMEPEEYQRNAVGIYNYSVLRDKLDMGLIAKERGERELAELQRGISPVALEAWEAHHRVNYKANTLLVDLVRQGILSFLFVGGDDGAPFCQTHYELRHLREYGRDLGKTQFQVTSGADELAMVMLCRAVTDNLGDIPFVYAAYNEGRGRKTIPSYCLDEIGTDVDGIITAAGGMQIPSPERAEFVLAINTNPDGKTGMAPSPSNSTRPREGTLPFLSMVKGFVEKGYPVGIGDIAYANGADNALMEQLRKEDLQFRIRAYGGWNTATNSVGFLIGTGLLSKWMDKKDADELMLTRYLDEWAYQAHVRQRIGAALPFLAGDAAPGSPDLDGKRAAAAEQGSVWMREFAREHIRLPRGLSLENLRISHPWNRLFECDILF